ncbi:MAG: Nif3-like dinuclear metal center hexameric protein [Nitrospirota bacterium]
MKKTAATIGNIAAFLNSTLRVKHIRDASRNGLQVRSLHRGEIGTVGFAVDACLSTFEQAARERADLLVVHHGIKWRPQKDRELELRRTAFLKRHDIALYAAHLPLDLHKEYGNNMQLCRMLGVQDPQRFGRYHGIKIGYAGMLGRSTSLSLLAGRLNNGLDAPCHVLPFGKDRIRSVGIVSGGGGGMLKDACALRLDCFVIGEVDLAVYNAAREYGMNLLVGGHYATETVGVRALMPLIRERFGVRTVFIDDPKDL